jgi:hypothetical protein
MFTLVRRFIKTGIGFLFELFSKVVDRQLRG